ncbi:MAG: response regulator [Candidatus Acidiferrales bacterium]
MVDDHEAARRGLCSLLSARADWLVCGEAVDGLEAVEKAKALRPDVVLMDVSMPRMNGLEATRVLRRDLPESKVVIVSQNDPTIVRRQVAEVDAAGYVGKIDASRDLIPTVDRIVGPRTNGSNGTGSQVATRGTSSADWLAGGGELGRLIREHDWSRSSPGPIDKWPQNLKISVSLMLNSQHPMWIGWGPEMTFFYNDAYISVLSLAKHPKSLGQPARQVWSEIWHICGPLAGKVFERGEGTFIDDVRFFLNRGDFLEENYISFSYSPIHDEAGNVDGLFCVNTDTSAKILNARRLATLSELSSTALVQKTADATCASIAFALAKNPDDVPFVALYLVDDTGTRAHLGESCGIAGGVRGLTPHSVELNGENVEQCVWPLIEVIKSGKSRIFSVKGIEELPTGLAQQRITEAIILPVSSHGEGGTVGILVAGVSPARKLDTEYRTFYELIAGQIATAIQNVRAAEEERKRLEALAEIDRAKTAFFSNVSHEFRTPLTLMLGPVEELLARSHTDLSPAARNQLELVNRNGARLLRLVNNLLDFSRIEAGRMQAIYLPTDLAAFTVDLASVFRSAMEKAGLRFELHCAKLSDPVLIDRGMWEKIVLNLISNAFKFTFEGEISVSLKQSGTDAELRVGDTGVGIPRDEVPRLFDRFHRVENTRSRTHEGSGIGLALVHELAKLHGGSVRVESALGKGSTFIVSVPLGSAHLPAERIGGARSLASTAIGAAPFVEEALRWLPDADTSEAVEEVTTADEFLPLSGVPESHGAGTTESRLRILVADDNSDMRQYLGRLLRERYDVLTVPDGRAAMAAVRDQLPDLILTDVMMPQLDGFGLLHELRADPQTKTIPVILLSARAGEESRVEGMEHGADDYLIKPFSARELLARVQGHLALALARKQGEQALREKERRLRLATEAAELGIWQWYPAEDLATWENDRVYEIYGRTREDGSLSSAEFTSSVIHPDDSQNFKRALTRTLAAGERFFCQSRIYRKDRSLVWVEFTGQLEQGTDGSPSRMLGTVLDISQRKQLAETLESQVQARTKELQERNREILKQSAQLRHLSHRLMQIQDEERRHIARELHDSAGQVLAALAMNVSSVVQRARQSDSQLAKDAEEAQRLVQELSQEIRTMSYLLHPPLLDESGLAEALLWYIRGLEERSGLSIALTMPEDFGRLSHEMELAIFRIVQECLTNVHRHSGSKVAAIRVARDEEMVTLEVQDEGRGMSAEKLVEIQSRGAGVGIRGMRERVLQLGGEMRLHSDDRGTGVLVMLPTTDSKGDERTLSVEAGG